MIGPHEYNLTINTQKEFGLYIDSWNNEEDAHQAVLTIRYPVQLRYVSVAKTTNNRKGVVFTCDDRGAEGGSEFGKITCDVGNPYRQGRKSMLVKFEIQDEIKTINLTVTADTTSAQPRAKRITSLARVYYVSEVTVDGYVANKFKSVGFSGDVIGQSAVEKASDAGEYVVHSYEISNRGVNDLKEARVGLSWPNRLANGKWLLYYIDSRLHQKDFNERTNGGFRCASDANVTNPLRLEYNRNEVRMSKRSVETDDKVSNFTLSKRSAGENGGENIRFNCPDYEGCLSVECEIDHLPGKSDWILEIRSVVWSPTFIEEYRHRYESMEVGSNLKFSSGRSDRVFSSKSKLRASAVSTVINECPKPVESAVEAWHFAVGVSVGVLVVAVIAVGCWKCGFFNRNRYHMHKAEQHQCATEQYSNETNVSQR